MRACCSYYDPIITQELRWTLIVLVSKVGPVFCDVILCTIVDNSETEQYLCDAVFLYSSTWLWQPSKGSTYHACVSHICSTLSAIWTVMFTQSRILLKKIDLYILSETEYRLGWISLIIHQKFWKYLLQRSLYFGEHSISGPMCDATAEHLK